MKICASVTLILAISLLLAGSDANNVTWGALNSYGVMLQREYVVKPGSWWNVAKAEVTYPPLGYINRYILSTIRVTDFNQKKGGKAVLKSGGPGADSATVQFISDRSHGLNYTIEFYGILK